MEAEETAGLPMTERVARDCRSGLLQTTSNRPWSAAKMNTHQLLHRIKEQGGSKAGRKGERGKEKESLEQEERRSVVMGNTNGPCLTAPINPTLQSIQQQQ